MALGENCTSTCETRDHETWGACMRAKNLRIAYCKSHLGQDFTRQKKWDARLAEYKEARDSGIQPDGTSTSQIRFAKEMSDQSGLRYGTEMRVAANKQTRKFDVVSNKDVADYTATLKVGDDALIKKAGRKNA